MPDARADTADGDVIGDGNRYSDQKDLITVTATPTPNPTPTVMSASLPALDAERTDLLEALAAARSVLTATTSGLGDEQAGTTPTVSALSLGGLIKHVAAIEEGWLNFVVDGPSAMRYDLPDGVTWADIEAGTAREFPQWVIDHRNNFRMLPGETLESVLKRYEQVAARTEEITAALPDLSVTHPLPAAPWHAPGAERSARRVLMQVIAETAQHAGHADILRESLDGRKAT